MGLLLDLTSFAPGFALEVLLRATVLLAIGAVLAGLALRRAPAQSRHLVWAMTLAGVLVMPALVAVSPAWAPVVTLPSLFGNAPQVPAVDPSTAAEVAATRQVDRAPRATEVSASTGVVWPATNDGPAGSLASTLASTAPHRAATAALEAPTPGARLARIAPMALLTLWALGSVLALLRHARSRHRAALLVRAARPACDPLLAPLARAIGVSGDGRSSVRLRESAAVAMPMTHGALSPTIVVPASFTSWDEAVRRDVLVHELAHVKRHDCLAQEVGAVARALYWFHPLAWLAERGLRGDAEHAADDLVLDAGSTPSAYASHLLTLARAAVRPPAPAVGLGGLPGSPFQARILAILAPKRRRRAALAALLVAGITGLASVTVQAAPPETSEPTASESTDSEPATDTAQEPLSLGEIHGALHRIVRESIRIARHEPRQVLRFDDDDRDAEDHDDGDEDREDRAERRKERRGERAYERALEEHHDGNYQEAIAGFQEAVDLGYATETSMYNLACGLARLGRTDEAVSWLERAITEGFDAAEYLETDQDLVSLRRDPRFQRLRDEHGDKGVRENALRELERLERRGETDGDDWYQAAMELHHLGEYDHAIRAWQKSIALGERDGASTYNIACALALKGDTGPALDRLERAVEEGFGDPDSIEDDDDLASLRREPRYRKALEVAAALDLPDDDWGMSRWKKHRVGPDWKEARRRYEAYLAEHPKSGRAWFNLGYAQLRLEDFKASAEAFERAFGLGHRSRTTAYNVACAYARMDDKDRAFSWLEKAEELGFESHGHVRRDPDLDNLRDDPRFDRYDRSAYKHKDKHEHEKHKDKAKDAETPDLP